MQKTLLSLCSFAVIFSSHISAQEKSTENSKKTPKSKNESTEANQLSPNLLQSVEIFSIPLTEATKLLRSGQTDRELYESTLKLVEAKTAKQTQLTILKSQSKERSTAESIDEYIYPAVSMKIDADDEVEEVEEVKEVKEVEEVEDFYDSPAMFERRNTGLVLELEPILSNDKKSANIKVAIESVMLMGEFKYGQGASEKTCPEFTTRRNNLTVNAQINQPTFLGTLNQPARAHLDNDDLYAHFTFLTVTLDK